MVLYDERSGSAASSGRAPRVLLLERHVAALLVALGVGFDGHELEEVGSGAACDHLGDDGGVSLLDHAHVVVLVRTGEVQHEHARRAAGGCGLGLGFGLWLGFRLCDGCCLGFCGLLRRLGLLLLRRTSGKENRGSSRFDECAT